MYYTLTNHPNGYHLSRNECLLSLGLGIGLPYTKRHWELSQKGHVWGHRVIAVLEAIPLIGILAALLERVSVLAYNKFFNHPKQSNPTEKNLLQELEKQQKIWKPRALPIEETMNKMWKNSEKAILEHRKKDPESYASVEEALPPLEKLLEFPLHFLPLYFGYCSAENIGTRSAMEDAHFYYKMDQGIITGVFDGHGGEKVAQYASHIFLEFFSNKLKDNNGNVHQTFEQLIYEIHEKVVDQPSWSNQGSTAVICLIDQETYITYTATLGDSEANLYRIMDENQLKSIPLSCVRDWSSKRDAQRAAIAMGDPQIAIDWPQERNPKELRCPDVDYCTRRGWGPSLAGPNVSRAIGDDYLKTLFDQRQGPKNCVIQKPKITVNMAKAGDILILGCDGLKDFVPEREIIEQLNNPQPGVNPAEQLMQCALSKFDFPPNKGDNVTVIVVKIS
jgi:serine/threonine protein phosphatase PrpC